MKDIKRGNKWGEDKLAQSVAGKGRREKIHLVRTHANTESRDTRIEICLVS